MKEARLRALKLTQDNRSVYSLIVSRNERSPFEGIETYLSDILLPTWFCVEMKEARLRALKQPVPLS